MVIKLSTSQEMLRGDHISLHFLMSSTITVILIKKQSYPV